MKKYEETRYVDKGTAAMIKRYLTDAAHPQGEDNTISVTVGFMNGVEIDIKCCGCNDETSWTEAVGFYHGCEQFCTEPREEFFGDWEIEHNDAVYVVHVIEKE